MKKETMQLQWSGTFVELCMGRVNRSQKAKIDSHCPDFEKDVESGWYENEQLLKTAFDVENWWSVDDLDHVMGLVFANRTELEAAMKAIRFVIGGKPATVDPDAFQLSFYAPEEMASPAKGERVLCHGARREAQLGLAVDFEPPFDPSLVTLSFIDYPDVGLILIDLDYDGHDDDTYTFGRTTYLQPRFI
ncbi:hypothetical protein [uncultured Desulfosarcina sp.]|uniref:hypothetical protein n=1 Tax=uncultured Desulfosarcina sp. TaxID=218289 RepID=UPI0029C868C3|nr:hypothetical protein [uncultured Desulfosarcina sp.]